MKKSATEYLKLIIHYLKTDKFDDVTDYSYCNQSEFKFHSNRRILLEKYISTRFNKGEVVNPVMYQLSYNGFVIAYQTDTKNLLFQINNFQKDFLSVDIHLDIKSKDEFFNFALENDVGYLKFEDIELLLEIVELVKINTKSGGFSDKLYANQPN